MLIPRMPKGWNQISLKKIKAFGEDFDLRVSRKKSKLEVTISNAQKILLKKLIKPDETLVFTFK